MSERMFKAIYEAPWLAAAVGLGGGALGRRGPKSTSWEQDELRRIKQFEVESQIESGTTLDAWARLLLYVRREENIVDERPYNLMRRMIDEMKPEHRPTLAAVKAAMKRQAFVLALDEERAIDALPRLLPEMTLRRKCIEAARKVVGARGTPTPHQEERFRRVEEVLSVAAPKRRRKAS